MEQYKELYLYFCAIPSKHDLRFKLGREADRDTRSLRYLISILYINITWMIIYGQIHIVQEKAKQVI